MLKAMEKSLRPITRKVKKSDKIIQINGKYYAEVNNHHVEVFLTELALSLAAEVDSLKERLLLLEQQIKMYND
ncbi:hypothetical protein CHU_1674 [Cytophaga hutchinsonii ATCC 33406]|uniref:Uncharacterized protein n=2 Tax=Cytophaga hutchinsonii TaxID=985 RepID=A0A6N4SRN9_CYTH3|nr:hypothetical protein CHU_1674 [Cytophaga hutchinsonii ATCC 33406]